MSPEFIIIPDLRSLSLIFKEHLNLGIHPPVPAVYPKIWGSGVFEPFLSSGLLWEWWMGEKPKPSWIKRAACLLSVSSMLKATGPPEGPSCRYDVKPTSCPHIELQGTLYRSNRVHPVFPELSFPAAHLFFKGPEINAGCNRDWEYSRKRGRHLRNLL